MNVGEVTRLLESVQDSRYERCTDRLIVPKFSINSRAAVHAIDLAALDADEVSPWSDSSTSRVFKVFWRQRS